MYFRPSSTQLSGTNKIVRFERQTAAVGLQLNFSHRNSTSVEPLGPWNEKNGYKSGKSDAEWLEISANRWFALWHGYGEATRYWAEAELDWHSVVHVLFHYFSSSLLRVSLWRSELIAVPFVEHSVWITSYRPRLPRHENIGCRLVFRHSTLEPMSRAALP